MSKPNQPIYNTEDVIDSRDVIARIEYLSDEDYTRSAMEETELATLRALASEGEGCGDWDYGEALIRDSYFTDYARELAENIGAIDRKATWPNQYIDWEAAAEHLKADYIDVDWDGVRYWIRS